jgi:hypothetical protein
MSRKHSNELEQTFTFEPLKLNMPDESITQDRGYTSEQVGRALNGLPYKGEQPSVILVSASDNQNLSRSVREAFLNDYNEAWVVPPVVAMSTLAKKEAILVDIARVIKEKAVSRVPVTVFDVQYIPAIDKNGQSHETAFNESFFIEQKQTKHSLTTQASIEPGRPLTVSLAPKLFLTASRA